MSEQTTHHALTYTWLEPKEPRWTDYYINRLRAAWTNPDIPRKDLPRHVGRTEEACDRMARLLGLGKRPAPRALPSHCWTPEQIAFLREHWPDIEAIQRATNRTVGAIEKQAKTQKLPPKTGHYKGPLPDTKRTAKAEAYLVIRHEAPPIVWRKCLCCGVEFEAAGKFLRMCPPCRKSA